MSLCFLFQHSQVLQCVVSSLKTPALWPFLSHFLFVCSHSRPESDNSHLKIFSLIGFPKLLTLQFVHVYNYNAVNLYLCIYLELEQPVNKNFGSIASAKIQILGFVLCGAISIVKLDTHNDIMQWLRQGDRSRRLAWKGLRNATIYPLWAISSDIMVDWKRSFMCSLTGQPSTGQPSKL